MSLYAGSLNPFDENARCRKCQYDAIGTEWLGAVHARCSLGPIYEAMPVTYLGYDEAAYKKSMGLWAERARMMPDHLERVCKRCGYRWAEALAVEAMA